jgi:hypothetical protein
VQHHHAQAFVAYHDNKQSSNPTRGGDTFGIELAKNHRFSSSGLNLTFERLLLGASSHLHVKAASSDPAGWVPELMVPPLTGKEGPSCFAGNQG